MARAALFLVVGAIMAWISGPVAAQQPTAAGEAATLIKPVPLIRQGRAPKIEELVQIQLATPPAPQLRDAPINPLRIPPELAETAARPENQDNSGTQLREFPLMANAPAVSLSLAGYSSDDNANLIGGRITPPDTNGDVGLTHYVQYVNVGWVFFDKATGAVASGPFVGNIFWAGFGGVCETQNAGDPIVLYDHIAGRWLFSQFTGTAVPDGHQCIAISDGEDPAGPYTLYDFLVSPGAFNDYPKIGLWPDGYYMTTHEFIGTTFQGVNLTVFERSALLAGTGSGVQFSPTTLEFGVQAANLEGPDLPPAGTCNYLVHATDGAAFGGTDRYQFWEACVDFATPTNSTLTALPSIATPPFDINLCGFSRDCIFQPSAQRLDPLAAFTMYRFNNRYFPAEGLLRSAVTNNVDVGGDRAGVMWAGFEIDPVTDAIAIGDGGDLLGVVDFADGLNRWVGSASVDSAGNIGIGYVRSSATSFPSIYFTVHERGVDAPGGVQAESVCVDGTGTHEGANRWADYASTSVDPVDSCTFWHTNEYVETTGNFQWDTRVCSFTIPSCLGGFVDVSLEQTVPATIDEPGGSVNIDITVNNNGGNAVDLTGLTHNLAGDLNGQGSCSVPQTIAVSGSYSCSFSTSVTGNAGDIITSVTTAQGDQSGTPFTANDSDDIAIADVIPEITVTKSASPDNVDEPGGDVTFSVQIQNTGDENVTLDSLVDDIHGNLNGQGDCSVPQTIITGGSYSCSFVATVTGNAGDSETDTITASVSDDDGNNVQGQDSATVNISDVLPEITLVKSASPDNVDEPGGDVTFSVQVQNTGDEAVTLDSLVDDIHGDLNGQGTCSVPQSIISGGSYSCSFIATVSGNAGDSETDTITASVSDDDGNNVQGQASATVNINDVLPQITVSKSASPDNVDEPGGEVSFGAVVQNTGDESVTLNSLVDDIHGDLNGQGTCSVPQNITAGGSYSCSFTATVSGNAGDSETDTITASVSDDEGNDAQGQASVTVNINDVLPQITVSKSASPDNVDEPGGDVTFSVQVQNIGVESVTLNSLVDDIHGDLNGQGACSVPQTINESGSYNCSFTVTVTGNAGDNETDTITATVADDDGNNVQGQASATVTINDVLPEIVVGKSASPDNVDEPSGDVTFSTQVQNTGAETVTLNSLVDDIHGDLNGQGTCSVPQTIVAAGSYSCSFTAMVSGDAGDSETDTITATVSDDDGNNQQGQASATVTINDVIPAIAVIKSASPDNVNEPGGDVTFNAQVQNTGDEVVTLNSLVDDIHGDLNGQGTCSVPQTIVVGGSYSCSFIATVSGNAGDSETDTITAGASDDDGNDVQGQDSATVSINDVQPEITVSKSASPDNVDEPGGDVTFSVQVQNTGDEDVTLNSLVDDIHGDLNGQGTCSVPQTLIAGSGYSCSFTVMVNGNAGDSETDTITATVADDEGNNIQGQASATVIINDVIPAISVIKSATPDNVNEPGGDVTFNVQVQNTGEEAVTLNTLVDDIHGDLNGQGTCSVPQTIVVGGSYSCSFIATVIGNAGDSETDTITAGASDDDGNNVQGQDSATVSINDVLPAIMVSKSASPDNVNEPGGNVTFSTVVENTGDEDVTLNSLVDDIHGDLNGQGTCSVPQTIIAGSGYACSFTVFVAGSAGDSETDTITASVMDDEGNAVQGQASATVIINNVATIINAPVSVNGLEDNPVIITSISVQDPGAPVVFISLEVSNGLLSLSGTTGLVFTAGNGTDDALVSFSGSVGDVNAALNGAVYQPAMDFNGSDMLAIAADDQPLSGRASSTTELIIAAVNDEPSFTAGPNQTVDNDAGPQVISPWATGISAGPADETGQAVSFEVVSVSVPALFSAQPQVASDGALSFTPQPGSDGVATVSVRILDNGGTANGGDDQSDTQSFSITVQSTDAADLSIVKGNGFGGLDENQTFTYTIVVSNAGPSAAVGATVTDAIPANLINASWVCNPAPGAACSASGNGDINDSVTIPAGGSVTYTLTVTVNEPEGGFVSNSATVASPPGLPDPVFSNNSSTDTDAVGLFVDGFESE